jgi:hypothetical protein
LGELEGSLLDGFAQCRAAFVKRVCDMVAKPMFVMMLAALAGPMIGIAFFVLLQAAL